MSPSNPAGYSVPTLGDILDAASKELGSATGICADIQWLIAQLLESAHHPDLPAELHMLQDIDRLQQELADLARLLAHVAQLPEIGAMGGNVPRSTITLPSLRERLWSEPDAGEGDASGDIDWF